MEHLLTKNQRTHFSSLSPLRLTRTLTPYSSTTMAETFGFQAEITQLLDLIISEFSPPEFLLELFAAPLPPLSPTSISSYTDCLILGIVQTLSTRTR